MHALYAHMTDMFQDDQELNPAYLNNQDILCGVSNWKTESLIPLGGSGPITHLQDRKQPVFISGFIIL